MDQQQDEKDVCDQRQCQRVGEVRPFRAPRYAGVDPLVERSQERLPGTEQFCVGRLGNTGDGDQLRAAVQPRKVDANITKTINARRNAGADSLSKELGSTRRSAVRAARWLDRQYDLRNRRRIFRCPILSCIELIGWNQANQQINFGPRASQSNQL